MSDNLNHTRFLLALESSCDDMAAAVMQGRRVLSSVVAAQSEHRAFGGVVPEIASRAHQRLVTRAVQAALDEAGISKDDLHAMAVTVGPGLPGSLLVGTSFARAFADGLQIPLVGVNHLEGHIYSVFLDQDGPEFPFICLIVSGGHTQLVLVRAPLDHRVIGSTRDDAAGEAFDKVGKLLGLEYPAGPEIDRLAASGDPSFYSFPRASLDGLDFSFSGIKTSVLYFLNNKTPEERESVLERHLADLCASFQRAVVDMLLENFGKAIGSFGVRHAVIAGGVSANSELRSRATEMCAEQDVELHYPSPQYCTDNAAMIGAAAMFQLASGEPQADEFVISPSLTL